MATKVGIVEARPETIVDDYRRVLELGGIIPAPVGSTQCLVVQSRDGGPGFCAPTWQIEGVKRAWQLKDDQIRLMEIGVEKHISAVDHMDDAQAAAPLLLTVPVLEMGWGVKNAVAAWARFCGLSVGDPRAVSQDLVRTLKNSRTSRPAVVCDGVFWGVRGGTLGKNFLQRNILLAGHDPVAVDCVALRLAGMQPLNFPWLSLLQEEGLGTEDTGSISIHGNEELLAAAFRGAPWVGLPQKGRELSAWVQESLWRMFRRRKIQRRFQDSAWGHLDMSLHKN